MPDQGPETMSSEPVTRSGEQNQSVSLNKSKMLSICGGGLCICFFLPWINSFLGAPSGFDLAKEGKQFAFLWSLPICCALTVAAGLAKRFQKEVALFTGLVPFFILIWGLDQAGKELFQILSVGGYAGLGLGLVMIIVALRLK